MKLLKSLLTLLLGALLTLVLVTQFPGVLEWAGSSNPSEQTAEVLEKDALQTNMSPAIALSAEAEVDADALSANRGAMQLQTDQDEEKQAGQQKVSANSSSSEPVLPARVGFDESAYVLIRDDEKSLTINATNVDEIRVRIYRIGERGLTENMSTNALLDSVMGGYQLSRLVSNSVTEVWRGQVSGNSQTDTAQDVALPINAVLQSDQKGLFLVVAENAEAQGFKALDTDQELYKATFATQWVNYTNLSLTTYSTQNGLYVGVRSYATGQSVDGVSVSLVAKNNEILEVKTTEQHTLTKFSKARVSGRDANQPRAIFAQDAKGDFAFLDLTKPAMDLSSFDATGGAALKRENLYFYTDRGVYRPGEEVRISGLMRDKIGQALRAQGVTLSIITPKGIEHQRMALTSDSVGQLQANVTLPRSAIRGPWRLKAVSDNDSNIVFNANFEVQDFVPELIEVELADDVTRLGVTQLNATVSSSFLYGAPASELNYQAELQFRTTRSPFPTFPNHLFGAENNHRGGKIVELAQGVLDAKGQAMVEASLLESLGEQVTDAYLYDATLQVAVQETGGRFKPASSRYFVDKADRYIGIKPSFKGGEIDSETRANFEVLAVDGDGKLRAETLNWQLQKVNHFYDWYKNASHRWEYRYETEYLTVQTGLVNFTEVDSQAQIQTDALPWGRYRLVVTGNTEGKDTVVASEYSFYSGYVWEASVGSENPSRIELYTDKKQYAIDDKMTVHFESLFDGVAQIVVVSDEVEKALEVPVKKGQNQFEMRYQPRFKLGVYVMATVIRQSKGTDNQHLPMRSVGMSWVSLKSKPIEVALSLPDSVEPRQRIKIPISVSTSGAISADGKILKSGNLRKTAGSVQVKVNAVDEGILAITGFETPDPFDYFWGKRQFSIDVRDEYNRLFSKQGIASQIRTGSGSDEGAVGGAGLLVVPAKTVSLFSGTVELDDSGRGTLELELPDFQGKLRLMTVASSAQSVGHAEDHLIVRDPVVSTVVMPNFLAPNDESLVTVRFFNGSETAQTVSAHLESDGTQQIVEVMAMPDVTKADKTDTLIKTMHLEANASKTVQYAIHAKQEGVAKLQLTMDLEKTPLNDKTLSDKTVNDKSLSDQNSSQTNRIVRSFELQVRYQGVPIPLVESREVKAGSVVVDASRQEGVLNQTISFSPLKALNLGQIKDSVAAYPYNCTEQLVNKDLPKLAELKILKRSNAAPLHQAKLTEEIQEGLDEILSRVNSTGRLGLWSYHGSEINPDLYPYVTEYMLQAKTAGFKVPSQLVTALATRMTSEGVISSRTIESRAYAAYVATLVEPKAVRFVRQLAPESSVLATLRQAQSFQQVGLLQDAADSLKTAMALMKANGLGQYTQKQYYQSDLSYQLTVLLSLAQLGQDTVVLKALNDFIPQHDLAALSHREKSLMLQVLEAVSSQSSLVVTHDNHRLPAAFLGAVLALDSEGAKRSQTFEVSGQAWLTTTDYLFSTKPQKGVQAAQIHEQIVNATTGKPADLNTLKVGDRLVHTVLVKIPQGDQAYLLDIPMPAGVEVVNVIEKSTGLYSQNATEQEGRYDTFDTLQTEFDRVIASAFGSKYLPLEFRVEFVSRAVTAGDYVKPGIQMVNMYQPHALKMADQVRVQITAE